MEKIKVNMSPNPLDIQTIHCSQGDTEAREWEFELHNNGYAIDSSSISDQLVFKAYKGGTEEILPTNGSTPTTSPFNGDIKYPQGLLTDQEFLYRESPTEEDGLAKLDSIKGNTLVWNQLTQSNNSLSKTVLGVTFTSNGNGIIHVEGTSTGTIYNGGAVIITNNLQLKASHKYYLKGIIGTPGSNSTYRLWLESSSAFPSGNRLIDFGQGAIGTASADETITSTNLYLNVMPNITLNIDLGVQLFDLTAMGLDSLTNTEIHQWFADYYPLPYYQYDSGSLLPFRGEGLKTVGFNQWDEEWEVGSINAQGQNSTGTSTIRSKNYISVFPNTSYFARTGDDNIGAFIYFYDADKNFLSIRTAANVVFSTPNECRYIRFRMYDPQYGTVYKGNICINISDPSKNGTYEPYTSSTLSLPISTYFPTGMKSAGTVYDELTPTKGITRIGAVDLGSLIWSYDSTHALFFSSQLSDSVPVEYTAMPNIICASYTTVKGSGYNSGIDKSISINDIYGIKRVTAKDSSYTDGSTFKNSLSGVYLYYELATPTETSFTTASLVTENAEIPLSNEDGVLIGKCTEQLSSESGFIDAKIKLADEDGECYSNKIQLHVERSPQ